VKRGLPALAVAFAFLAFVPAPFAASGSDRTADQLDRHGVRDRRIVDAFRHVRRDVFATGDSGDRDRSSLPANVVAAMIDALGLHGDERVLAIGTGSGYHAAILAELAKEVYALEPVPQLAANSRLRLTHEDYRNVHVKQGPGGAGWREYGPYRAIIVFAAASRVPQPLIDQLDEGGVLVMPLGDPREHQVMIRGVKRAGKLRSREMADVQFPAVTVALAGAESAVRPALVRDDRAAERERVERARAEDEAEAKRAAAAAAGPPHDAPRAPDVDDDDEFDDNAAPAPAPAPAPRHAAEPRDEDVAVPEHAPHVPPPDTVGREASPPPPDSVGRDTSPPPEPHRAAPSQPVPAWQPDEDDAPAPVHHPVDDAPELRRDADDERHAPPADELNEDRDDLDDSDPDTDTAPRHGE
jgi:protein-L-isoaspartate(D-aspartate) O-methyltransferase